MKQYAAPEITLVGSVERLTAGLRTGDALDRNFSAGTSVGKLTFS